MHFPDKSVRSDQIKVEHIFTLCSTAGCPLAILCERKHRKPVEKPHYHAFEMVDGECDWYVARQAISDEKHVFRGQGRKGMKSNKHVAPHVRKRMTAEELGLVKPDLKVSRHIKMGQDINKNK